MVDSRVDRETGRRALIAWLAWYLGCTLGWMLVNEGRFEPSLLIPLNMLGWLAASMLTPLSWPMLGLGVLLSVFYVGKRLPHWSCVIVGLLAMGAAAVALSHWKHF